MSEKRISVWCKADNQPGGVPEDYETRSYVPRSEIEAVVLETLAEVTAPPNWMTDGPLSVNVLRVRLDQMRAAARRVPEEPQDEEDPFLAAVRELVEELDSYTGLILQIPALAKVRALLEEEGASCYG